MFRAQNLLIFILIFTSLLASGQRYTQSGVVHTEIQMYNKNGVQINGVSKEAHIEYSGDSKMQITVDPKTFVTDNIEFNRQLDNAFIGNFKFIAEFDASTFEYQSRYNETLEIEAETEINNEYGVVTILLIVNNQNTTNENRYVIVGKGEVGIDDYKLNELFPELTGVLKFQFTQNLTSKYR